MNIFRIFSIYMTLFQEKNLWQIHLKTLMIFLHFQHTSFEILLQELRKKSRKGCTKMKTKAKSGWPS